MSDKTQAGLSWNMPTPDVIKNVELPSGNIVLEMKKPDVWMLVDEDGNVPSSIEAILKSSENDKDLHNPSSMVSSVGLGKSMLAMRDLDKLGGHVAKQIFLKPTIGDEIDLPNFVITLDALTSMDKRFVAQWALSGGEGDVQRALARFRAEQQKFASSTSGSE